MIKLYKTSKGPLICKDDDCYDFFQEDWDKLLNQKDTYNKISKALEGKEPLKDFSLDDTETLAPIGSQEVWAAGVTYYRSRDARMEESEAAGGGDFYDKVYSAERPELFMKATPHRVVGSKDSVRIRKDSKWNVPEPELTLVINSNQEIIGYTIGNDMSSRDIEGENPLYLPQAKVYDRCCSLGPCIVLTKDALPTSTEVQIQIERNDETQFKGSTNLAELKRSPEELVEFLYRESSFPTGSFLMTGTGVVPPTSFTLEVGDKVSITINPIGTLENTIEQ